ncbi:hypothetical protein HT746_15535 [Burkholderia pyrrocinia]|uniref:hypothetical protein n=1 Tax=Burkholderia pyrrocinia TaxID=60550 RepID=UPI001575326E|nr:hypothetical protein [Burkholderia pyrrocinia]NTX28524.1 hypothetical protein [Burkholderia pyrrocinia]
MSSQPGLDRIKGFLPTRNAEHNTGWSQSLATCHVTITHLDDICDPANQIRSRFRQHQRQNYPTDLCVRASSSTLKTIEFSSAACAFFVAVTGDFIFTRPITTNDSLAIRPTCHVTTTTITKICITSNAFLDISITSAYITQNSLEEFNGFQDRRQ